MKSKLFYLGGFLREEDAAFGFCRLDDSLHQDAVERWDETLHHFSILLLSDDESGFSRVSEVLIGERHRRRGKKILDRRV